MIRQALVDLVIENAPRQGVLLPSIAGEQGGEQAEDDGDRGNEGGNHALARLNRPGKTTVLLGRTG